MWFETQWGRTTLCFSILNRPFEVWKAICNHVGITNEQVSEIGIPHTFSWKLFKYEFLQMSDSLKMWMGHPGHPFFGYPIPPTLIWFFENRYNPMHQCNDAISEVNAD